METGGRTQRWLLCKACRTGSLYACTFNILESFTSDAESPHSSELPVRRHTQRGVQSPSRGDLRGPEPEPQVSGLMQAHAESEFRTALTHFLPGIDDVPFGQVAPTFGWLQHQNALKTLSPFYAETTEFQHSHSPFEFMCAAIGAFESVVESFSTRLRSHKTYT